MEYVFADLLGLCSCHSNNAADTLRNGLLGDDDKRCSMTRVLQMAADNRKQQQINNGVAQLWKAAGRRGENITEQDMYFRTTSKISISELMPGPHEEKNQVSTEGQYENVFCLNYPLPTVSLCYYLRLGIVCCVTPTVRRTN